MGLISMMGSEDLSKEKPILFSTEMVKAILDGRKTMTRRIVKKDIVNGFDLERDGKPIAYVNQATGDSFAPSEVAPYQVGDILWVRETWAIHDLMLKPRKLNPNEQEWFYKGKFKSEMAPKVVHAADYPLGSFKGAWRPSIHMPRKAARLFLKVTNIRVERLQDITEEDALAEGCKVCPGGYVFPGTAYDKAGLCHSSPEMAFQVMWGEMYPDSDISPWVWVVEFERVEDMV